MGKLGILGVSSTGNGPFCSSLSDVKNVSRLCLHCIKSLVSLHNSLRSNMELEIDLNRHWLPPPPLSPQKVVTSSKYLYCKNFCFFMSQLWIVGIRSRSQQASAPSSCPLSTRSCCNFIIIVL